MAISTYTGIDLGFGVITVFAGMMLVGVGLDAVLVRTPRFARLAVLPAVVIVAAAVASVIWIRGLTRGIAST